MTKFQFFASVGSTSLLRLGMSPQGNFVTCESPYLRFEAYLPLAAWAEVLPTSLLDASNYDRPGLDPVGPWSTCRAYRVAGRRAMHAWGTPKR